MKRTIIQLPTIHDTAPMPSSTKHVYRGPTTLLQTEYPDGTIYTIDYDYMPHATIESLIELARKYEGKNV